MRTFFSSADWSFGPGCGERRALLAADAGLPYDRLTFCEQTHGSLVAEVTAPLVGRGRSDRADALPVADALISNTPGAALCILTADCVPVLLLDEAHHAAAAIHSGWRGTAQNIVGATIAAMAERFGSGAEGLRALIGPHIRRESYEVDLATAQAVGLEFATPTAVRADGEHYLLSLTEAVTAQLLQAGVNLIEDCGTDTFAADAWPSHRRNQTPRRLLSCVLL